MWLVDSIVSSMALAQKAAVAMAAAPVHTVHSGGRPAVAGAPVPVLVPRRSQRSHVTRAGVQPVQAVASPPAKPAAAATTKPAAKITGEEAQKLYHDMVLGREFEEMCAQMYYRGKMFGFVHLYSGQEAVSTGAPPQRAGCRAACFCCVLAPGALHLVHPGPGPGS